MERASPAALSQFWKQVREHNIPYWGRNCVVRVLKSVDRELQDIPVGALLALPISQFTFHTQGSPWLNLPFTTAFNTTSLISLKTVAIHLTSSISILPLSQTAILPVTQSCLLAPTWPSCSQAAAAQPCPPLWPSCCSPTGTTLAATTAATLTPPGSTTSKASGQVIGFQTATLAGPATT